MKTRWPDVGARLAGPIVYSSRSTGTWPGPTHAAPAGIDQPPDSCRLLQTLVRAWPDFGQGCRQQGPPTFFPAQATDNRGFQLRWVGRGSGASEVKSRGMRTTVLLLDAWATIYRPPNGLELPAPFTVWGAARPRLLQSIAPSWPGPLPWPACPGRSGQGGLGRQRDWNEKAGSSETCFIVYDEPHLNALKGAKGGTGHV